MGLKSAVARYVVRHAVARHAVARHAVVRHAGAPLCRLGSGLAAGILLLFTLRRWLLLLAALRPPRPPAPSLAEEALPTLLLLAPLRDEAAQLPAFLQALSRLDYPPDRLTLVFIDDGSRDETGALLAALPLPFPASHILTLPANAGKAAALQAALERFPQGEIVAVFDADERPQPAILRHLVAALGPAEVGAASGQRLVANPTASLLASYATFEALVHQQVTCRGKDRLDLAPPLLGSACAYRRAALEEAGGFRPGALLEDSDLTVRLARAGWHTRFVPQAASAHRVPETMPAFWQQHRRWNRGFHAVARSQVRPTLGSRALPWPLRLELLAFSLGYLDRLATLATTLCLALPGRKRRLPALLLLSALLAPLFQVMVVLRRGPAPASLGKRLFVLPLFLPLDVAAACAALGQSLLHRPALWEKRPARP